MTDFEDYFKDEYITNTQEKIHDKYRVVIHTYDTKNYQVKIHGNTHKVYFMKETR